LLVVLVLLLAAAAAAAGAKHCSLLFHGTYKSKPY